MIGSKRIKNTLKVLGFRIGILLLFSLGFHKRPNPNLNLKIMLEIAANPEIVMVLSM